MYIRVYIHTYVYIYVDILCSYIYVYIYIFKYSYFKCIYFSLTLSLTLARSLILKYYYLSITRTDRSFACLTYITKTFNGNIGFLVLLYPFEKTTKPAFTKKRTRYRIKETGEVIPPSRQ